MTVIVGLLCQDGVVIGSDSAATFTTGTDRTIEQETKKIEILDEKIIVAGTGAVGLGQRFNAIVEDYSQKGSFEKTTAIESGKNLARFAIQDFQSTGVLQTKFGALVAFPIKNTVHLCEFAEIDFQPEFKTENLWYVSMGSGQKITDPFLGLMRKVFWGDGPPILQEGVFAVTWALQNAIDLNPGGINGPIQLAVLRINKDDTVTARFLDDSEIDYHLQKVEDAVIHLRDFSMSPKERGANIPDIPKP